MEQDNVRPMPPLKKHSTLHTTNSCKVIIDQGSYTYFRNNILDFIFSQLDKKLYTV